MKKYLILFLVYLLAITTFAYENSTIIVSVYGVNTTQDVNSIEEYEIEIYKEGETPDIANKKATEAHDAVIEALLGLEIPESNITRNNNHQSHFNDNLCFVRKTINIVLTAADNKDAIFNAVIEAGASGYNDLRNFGLIPGNVNNGELDLPGSKKEAALEAKRKADELAEAFGAQVGRIISLRDLNYGRHTSNEFGIEVTYELIY